MCVSHSKSRSSTRFRELFVQLRLARGDVRLEGFAEAEEEAERPWLARRHGNRAGWALRAVLRPQLLQCPLVLGDGGSAPGPNAAASWRQQCAAEEEAQQVLHPLLEKEPRSLGLALLMADLRRLNGDSRGARTDLDQLLRLHPDHPEVLKLRVLVEIQDGRTTQALQLLTQRFQNLGPGRRGDMGMLLADLQRRSGQVNAAAGLYQQLAEESPTDARPLLALAMLRQEQGKAEEVSDLLTYLRLPLAALGLGRQIVLRVPGSRQRSYPMHVPFTSDQLA